MKTKQVSVGDSMINLVDEGNGQTILFVHGFPLDHSMWQFQVLKFVRHYRVICPDLAGFGASPSRKEPMSMMSFANQLAELLDVLNVDRPVVYCGLSMGGYIGWQFWKHHADKLSHLIACDTRAAGDSPEVARARKVAAQSVRKTGSQPVAEAMLAKLFYRPNDSATKPITEPVFRVMSQTSPESIAGAQLAMAERPDATTWLPEIALPTLFVVGDHDQITPPNEMRANATKVADAEFATIHQAGHMSPLENPSEFNRVMAAFLDRN